MRGEGKREKGKAGGNGGYLFMVCGTGELVARYLVLQLSYQKLGSTSRRRARLTLDPADLEMGRQGSAHGRDLHDGDQPNIGQASKFC